MFASMLGLSFCAPQPESTKSNSHLLQKTAISTPSPDPTTSIPSNPLSPLTSISNLILSSDSQPQQKPEIPKLCANLHDWVCNPAFESASTKDITGIMAPDAQGESDALSLLEKIINTDPPVPAEQIDEVFARKVYTPARRVRLESAFLSAKTRIIELVKSWIPEQERQHDHDNWTRPLIRQLRMVRLEIPPPAHLYSDEPDLLTKNDVFFEHRGPTDLVIRVGGGYVLSSRSWFNLISTFAHEIGHAIDPCEMHSLKQPLHGYRLWLECMHHIHLIEKSNTDRFCKRQDTTAEVFADWVSAQVLAKTFLDFSKKFNKPRESRYAFRNALRDLCGAVDDPLSPSFLGHPSSSIRINKIFGAQPEILEKLQCPLPEIPNVISPRRSQCEIFTLLHSFGH